MFATPPAPPADPAPDETPAEPDVEGTIVLASNLPAILDEILKDDDDK